MTSSIKMNHFRLLVADSPLPSVFANHVIARDGLDSVNVVFSGGKGIIIDIAAGIFILFVVGIVANFLWSFVSSNESRFRRWLKAPIQRPQRQTHVPRVRVIVLNTAETVSFPPSLVSSPMSSPPSSCLPDTASESELPLPLYEAHKLPQYPDKVWSPQESSAPSDGQV